MTAPESPNEEIPELSAGGQQGIVGELWGYLWHTRKWWLFPIIAILFLLGLFVVVGGSSAGPLIYTLF